MFKVAAVVGSLRRESINSKMAGTLVCLANGKLDLRSLDISEIPLFNQDLEAELPPAVTRFKAEVANADAILFVTPEYNRSIPGVMKNVIDWGTRPAGQNSWTGKPAAIIGASGGRLGTVSAQQHLRNVLAAVNMSVMSQPEAAITLGRDQMNDVGAIIDAALLTRLEKFLDRFVAWIERQSPRP